MSHFGGILRVSAEHRAHYKLSPAQINISVHIAPFSTAKWSPLISRERLLSTLIHTSNSVVN